ncbi:NAD(P)/FAD-dependent oxidoreductase [Paenibacillus sp. J5C_2022]|uniref:NAD(P)/FAD-dependent oxidoreductase n=1 Tax=Paenibacillus sp. J5C2022 TaxID=2977129 RepID=UPI0021D23808|nr:NAD(P)/FAD-dependent oxidoreductase [Paenibacillus sp. J5C2022]MCU6707904.1 NAD(P)/FAD-dependent oxidoreductase [Paenibacillus sp. J5C2022]
MSNQVYDITIIGGGPAGLFGAFYSGLRGLKTKIIEFQSFLGGKVHVYPEKMIWDVGGLTPVSGEQLIKQLIQQGLTFDPTVVLGQKVIAIEKGEDGVFKLKTHAGEEHYSKTVLLAVGGGILKPMKLNIEGAERFEVSNLHYTVKSLARFRGKRVLISGGGNAAIDWASELEPIADKVYLTYRNDMLKGHEAVIDRLQKSTAELLLNTTIEKLVASPEQDRIAKVVLKHTDEEAETELAIDEVIINHGYERDKELLENSRLNIDQRDGYWIVGKANSETTVEGLYAAGDILTHEGKLHLIAGAFQDAANAVNRAKTYIEPEARPNGMVSSHNEVFEQRNRELVKHLYKS